MSDVITTIRPAGFVRRFSAQRSAVGATALLVGVAAAALLAPLIAPADPLSQDLRAVLQAPSLAHPLGTDELGRDVLSQLLFASRVSLVAGFQAVAVALILGVPMGLLAGYVGGRLDLCVMRVNDALMSFPPLILAIAIVAALGPGLTNAMIAVGLIFTPRFVRIVRAATLTVAEETYIEASRSIGTPSGTIVARHVVPNVLAPVIVQVSLALGLAMLAEASLSFLGLGVQPPDTSWGSMLGRAFRHLDRAPWLVFVPGVLIASSVLAFNVIGDGLRDSVGRRNARST